MHAKAEREVAIKTLLPDLPEDFTEEVRARLLLEAESAGGLNRPNIINIDDVGEQDGVARTLGADEEFEKRLRRGG